MSTEAISPGRWKSVSTLTEFEKAFAFQSTLRTQLALLYAQAVSQASDDDMLGLLIGEHALADEAAFKAELVSLIPHLRAFAFSLAGGIGGEDLAQEAMLKAWKSRTAYQPGTNMKAWAFTILRNQFISGRRRDWRSQPLDPEVAESTLIANDDQHVGEELRDVRNAMVLLPDIRREMLMLAAAGLSYEELAKIFECAVGTVKSRISRARAELAAILARGDRGRGTHVKVGSTRVFDEFIQAAADLKQRYGSANSPSGRTT